MGCVKIPLLVYYPCKSKKRSYAVNEKEKKEYLGQLAEDFDIDIDVVHMIADLLGENEYYDGLLVALEDYSNGDY